MSAPRVSVVMSVYNGEPYLRSSIDSVLEQRLSDLEFLIADDASTDASCKIIQSYSDPRIVFLPVDKNRGLFANLNALIGRASAPLIKPWSQDDVMGKDCLQKGTKFYHEHPEVGCFYSSCRHIDDHGRVLGEKREDSTPLVLTSAEADRYALLHGCLSPNISNLVFPKKVMEAVGPLREDMMSADFEMMVRIQGRYPIGRVPDALVDIRVHRGQWSRRADSLLRTLKDDIEIYRTLERRICRQHRSMTTGQVKKVLKAKYARNSFHGALNCLARLRWAEALRIFSVLKREAPLADLMILWGADLPARIGRRWRRRP